MLKKFFLNTLSSFVGAWIALVLFGVVAAIVCVGLISKLSVSNLQNNDVKKGSVMVINLAGRLVETEQPMDFDFISLMQRNIEQPQTLSNLKNAIESAGENENVSAIYLKCNGIAASPATLNALRNALIEFKKTGKKILAYGDGMAMGDYYVASVADELYLNPAGNVIIQGLGTVNLYFKPLFDKLGIEFQVVKVGTFKSAVEPYILPEMSVPARAQLDTLFGNMWSIIRKDISETRKSVTPVRLDSLVSKDFLFLQEADFDLKNKLVDGLYYERSMDSVIASSIHRNIKELNFVTADALVDQEFFSGSYFTGEQIAVLYATGEIMDGGGAQVIDFERIVPIITKLADDDNVKGMVMRVNSPGGSVFGSEQIGEALDYFQSKGKKLAVSMGDYAASGGYWISCCADRIFANPLTITGSIGIFGLIPNAQSLLDKIGVRPQLVSTNPNANFPSLYKPLTEPQMDAMQKMVERGYDKFVSRVARGRKLSEQRVRQIGEGRVWDAVTAQKIGLVDELGDLESAIKWVADAVNIENYNVTRYPQMENSIWNVLYQYNQIGKFAEIKSVMPENIDNMALEILMKIFNRNSVQARMPEWDVRFDSPLR